MTNQNSQETSEGKLTITILYDNNPFDKRLKTSWGFSAMVECQDHTALFDTGGDGSILLCNMNCLGIDPTKIESVILSNAHRDHAGGLGALLKTGIQPTVYLLPSFPTSFKRDIAQITSVVDVSPGMMLAEKIFTMGEMNGSIPEQALIIKTEQGMVILIGCAHAGVANIVEQAQASTGESVHLVMGGFHLGSTTPSEIASIIADFRRIGVECVAPCHCIINWAIAMFANDYRDDFIQTGVGSEIVI